MVTATLSSKFQISIPQEVRETLNRKPDQRLAFLCVGKSAKLVPQPRIEDVLRIGKGANPGGYRDRGNRREDSLPKRKPPSTSTATAAKSRRAT